MKFSRGKRILWVTVALAASVAAVCAQTAPLKKNARPADSTASEAAAEKKVETFDPVYSYEFTKPEFIVSRVLIEHDESGVGTLIFEKRDFDEAITEPLRLSAKTLEKLKEIWTAIDFLNSSGTYQSVERDYGHLGTVRLKMNKDGKERISELNWTEIPEVKELTDEYRRIGNQVIWVFDMDVARRNQQLETPSIVDRLDTLIRLNSIADAEQLLTYLKELNKDERLPLIARNHTGRLIVKIESSLKKKD